ncbi:MAG: RidA family protein [Chloroflexota bacterium]|nr:RidA family protein [Chloroflexota bacterium]
MKIEQKLQALGFDMDEAPPSPVANYVGAVQTGNLLFISGHGPSLKGQYTSGRLGADLTLEEGYQAARLTAVACLRSAKQVLGDLDRVKRVVKVLGMVMCVEGFVDTPRVINGCSDLMVELYGEAGRHARSAVGMQQLPANIPVEIEMVLEVE